MMKRIWPAAFALAVGLSCLDAPAGVPSAAKGIVWSDDFSKPGAPAPGWEGDVFVWCARDGRLEGSWLNSAFAFPPPRMLYHAVSAEVLATPQKANGKSWKIAALAMVQDERNFWHLGLVEKPDAAGSGHFVELCEMRDGHWLSQHNLKSTVYRGNDLAWKYGQAYRLRIALTPQGVTGTVSAPDGRELTRIGFAFTGRAVAAARPALRVIAMSAAFDDFRMEAAPAGAQPIPKPPEKTFPPYAVKGSGVRAPGRATGFFRVARVGDRHWLVDPRGELFFAVGTDHVNYYAHWCQKLGYAPYNRFCQKKYGLVERWAESAAARLRAWGFNLLGAGNIEPVRYHGLAHTLFAAFGSSFAGYSALVEKVHWTGFPNVFDPLWPAYCEARAKKLCAPNGKDPWLLGYFLDNELEWWGKEHTPTGIFTDTMKWPRDHSGKRALVDFLRRQHGSIAEFNRVWKQHIASWDELLGMMRLPAATDEARAIQHRFIARVADRYFTVATRAIRKYDPNHLVIGCRFAGNAPEEAWKGCARTCDVVTFNHYPRIDFESGDLSGLAAVFEKYHALTQRPMMITEWSFPALDAGLPCTHGAGMRVDTQQQKARCFTLMQHMLFRLPFMVGSDYFMWADEPAQGISDTFPEDSNYGLVNVEDKPYPELIAACRRLNPLAVALHSGKVAEIYLEHAGLRNGKLEITVKNLASVPTAARLVVEMEGKTIQCEGRVPANGQAAISAPTQLAAGGHIVRVRLQRDAAALLGCRGKTSLLTGVYRAGLPWPRPRALARRPLFVLNPSDTPCPPAPVFMDDPFPRVEAERFVVRFASATPAVRLGSNTVVFRAPAAPARSGLAGLLYAERAAPEARQAGRVTVERIGKNGFRIDNGVLELRNDGKSGNVVDRISVNGVCLGSYNPLIWQAPGQNQWVRASEIEHVSIRRLPGGPVLVDVTAAGGEPAGAITEVNADGKAASRRTTPVRFQVAHRFIVWPGEPWFACRVLWVRNADTVRTLRVKGAFFFLPSRIGGRPEGDQPGWRAWPQVPNYYRRRGAAGVWSDSEAKAYFGAAPLTADSRIAIYFWLDKAGGQHPDARIELKPPVDLAPGQKKSLPNGDWLLVFGARETATAAPDSWTHLRDLLTALPRTVVHTGPVERAFP